MTKGRTALALTIAISLLAVPGWAQFKKRHLPPPLKVFIPHQSAWKAMLETVQESTQLKVADQDRAGGRLVTEFRDYISGPLTRSHLEKVGDPPRLADGNWIKARYRYDIRIELIEAKVSIVTVNLELQGFKRDFLGEEAWVDVNSSGRLESDLLTAYGKLLFGSDFALERPKKGFWERDPSYVPDPQQRVPRIASPERPPS